MARVTFSSGEVPSVSKMNSLADQCVIQSNSEPSSPLEGMMWYDTNAAHPLISYYNGTDWAALPMGVLTKETLTLTGPGVYLPTTINGSQLTFTAIADQRYHYMCDFVIVCDQGDDLWLVTPQIYASGSWTDDDTPYYIKIGSTSIEQRHSIQMMLTPAAGASGFRLRIERYYGTGTASILAGTDASVAHVGSL